jgi:hypothetical protein
MINTLMNRRPKYISRSWRHWQPLVILTCGGGVERHGPYTVLGSAGEGRVRPGPATYSHVYYHTTVRLVCSPLPPPCTPSSPAKLRTSRNDDSKNKHFALISIFTKCSREPLYCMLPIFCDFLVRL